jgi:hypothetical protein
MSQNRVDESFKKVIPPKFGSPAPHMRQIKFQASPSTKIDCFKRFERLTNLKIKR